MPYRSVNPGWNGTNCYCEAPKTIEECSAPGFIGLTQPCQAVGIEEMWYVRGRGPSPSRRPVNLRPLHARDAAGADRDDDASSARARVHPPPPDAGRS